MGHMSTRENGKWVKKLRYYVIYEHKHEFQAKSGRDLCKKPAWKRDFVPPFGASLLHINAEGQNKKLYTVVYFRIYDFYTEAQ